MIPDEKQKQKQSKNKMNYGIYSSRTGETIIDSIDLPQDQVENLSNNTDEGFFLAGALDELVEAGVDPELSVYALVK